MELSIKEKIENTILKMKNENQTPFEIYLNEKDYEEFKKDDTLYFQGLPVKENISIRHNFSHIMSITWCEDQYSNIILQTLTSVYDINKNERVF